MDIWIHNRSHAEQIQDDITLSALGGLVVQTEISKVHTPDNINAMVRNGLTNFVNLAFSENSNVISGQELLEASREQSDNPLAEELPQFPWLVKSMWLFPVSVMQVIETEKTRV